MDLTSFMGILGKESLVSALMVGTGLPEEFRSSIPEMPSEAIQISTTGKAGKINMQEAIDFCQIVMEKFHKFSGSGQPLVLDFGCGWGRITRTFLSVAPPSRVTGADVRHDAVEMAKALAPEIKFVLIEPRPPAKMFTNGAFNLVVAYSVFSHLAEDVAQAWIDEFARIVSPGGLVCITTRSKSHLLNAQRNASNAQNLDSHQKQYATMLSDFGKAISQYEAGEFVYVPTGGGGVLTSDFYGEAIVPKSYVEKHYEKYFTLLDWVDKFSDIGSQPIIVLKRRLD